MRVSTAAIGIALGLVLAASHAVAQDGTVPPSGAPGSVTIPDAAVLEGATAAPACGNLYGLSGRALCVTAPLASVGALAEAYIALFEARGWQTAGGDDNRVVLLKPLEGGGCEGLQMLAFYDESRPAAPEAPGYIAMATIPGDVCTAALETPAAPATPSAPQ